MVTSDLFLWQRRKAHIEKYIIDKQKHQEFEPELRPLLVVSIAGDRKDIIKQLTPHLITSKIAI